MALPSGITPKTVTFGIGSFFDGNLVDGTVTITAPVNVLHTPTGRPIFSSAMTQKIVDGEVTFSLCPTDDPNLNRVDWTYKMTVKITGALVQPDPIYFVLPTAGPDTVDLDALVSVPSSAGTPVSVTAVTSVAGQTGTVTSAELATALDADETRLSDASLRAAFVPLRSAAKYVASTGVAATDTAALQAAHDALPSTGGSIYLDAGPYVLTAGSVNFTKPIHLIGSGPSGANVANGSSYLAIGSQIQCASATGVAIAVNADGCHFEKLYFKNTSGTAPTAGAAVQVQTLGKSTRIVDCSFDSFYVGFEFVSGYEWALTGCHFMNPVYAGMKINDAYSADAGDPVVSDSFFYAGPTNLTPQAAIRWESGGALKVHGCKVNSRGSARFTTGIDFQIKDGATTEGGYIVGNSIENVTYGIDVGQLGPSNTGVLNYMTVVGNQFGGVSAYSVRVKPTNTSVVMMQKFTVVGNVLTGGTAGCYVEHVNYPVFASNTTVGGSVPALAWGGGTNFLAFDETMSVQSTLTGTTAGSVVSSMPYCSQNAKKFVAFLNGYENTTASGQSVYMPVGFTNGRITADTGASGATFDTALRLPKNMAAPVTGMIVIEGY